MRRIFGLALLLTACGGDSTSPPPVPTAMVHNSSDQLGVVGEPLPAPISVRVLDSQARPVQGVTVRWTAANDGQVTPSSTTDANGAAQATWTLGPTPGPQTATAEAAGLPSLTFQTVASPGPLSVIRLRPDSAHLVVGDSLWFEVIFTDRFSNSLPGGPVTWSSDAPDAASVSSRGSVTALGAAPRVTITARSGEVAGSARLTITRPAVQSVVVSPATVTMDLGTTRQLGVEVRDSRGRLLRDRVVEWSSSDASVVSVTAAGGVITGKAPGSATITASAEGVRGDAQVRVVRPPTPVGGIIRENTTWELDRSPFVLAERVQVAPDVTLTIEPGVEVRAGAASSIQVFGTLRAVGTANQLVHMEGLTITDNDESSAPSVQIEHADLQGVNVSMVGGGLVLRSSLVTGARDAPYRVSATLPFLARIEGNRFSGTGAVQLYLSTWYRPVATAVFRSNAVDFTAATLSFGGPADRIEVAGNNFTAANRPVFTYSSGDGGNLNAANNYWGTTDEAVIQTMIRDRNDDLNIDAYVEYRPFLTSPAPGAPRP